MQYFPTAWKEAKIVPVPKAGKPINEPASYRPISLLSSLSKLYERILKEKMLKTIDENNILPNEQFGFRGFHSTIHQILRICRSVKINRAVGKSTGLLLLDIEKAFDTVWHNGLLHKMLRMNFPIYICKVVQSFLSDRCYKVYVNNNSSGLFNLVAGVPQGSVLGPILYNLYISDFPQLPQCGFALYADDSAIFSSHEFGFNIETNLKDAAEIVIPYFNKWKIKVNTDKMQAIFFTRKRKSCFLPPDQLTVNGQHIKWESSVKYLGVYLDKKLTFNEHISKTLHKTGIAIKMLYPFINRNSLLSNHNKIILYKVIFQAILLYGCQVWGDCAKCHIKRLQVQQNKLLKMMLKLPWYHATLDLHSEANVELISDRIRTLTETFKIRCNLSDNTLINDLNINNYLQD